jgi:hypothetical protein
VDGPRSSGRVKDGFKASNLWWQITIDPSKRAKNLIQTFELYNNIKFNLGESISFDHIPSCCHGISFNSEITKNCLIPRPLPSPPPHLPPPKQA